MLSVTFCGAARTVTGSQYFLEYQSHDGSKFVFCLDSGFFQVGQKVNLNKINSHLLFDPRIVDAIVLTHAHLDHCGRIPYLVKMGFGGKIYATEATKKIAQIVMEDTAKHGSEGGATPDIQQVLGRDNSAYAEDSDTVISKKVSKIADKILTEGLYALAHVDQTMTRFKTFEYHQKFRIHPNLEVEFWDAGHILGSAYVVITELSSGKKIVFSGDMGNDGKPIIEDPEMPPALENITHIFTETTYGNKVHGQLEPKKKLLDITNKTLKRGGKLFIPSFSVERAQEVIYFLVELMREGKIDNVPIYLDSPMASKVLQVTLEHPELYDASLRARIKENANPLIYKNLKILETTDDSKTINKRNKPAIIIAGSGMMTGGRIIKHLQHNIENPLNTVLVVGYQAHGTLGREIFDGASEVEIEGRSFQVKAEIASITEFSAHADQLLLKKWIVSLVHKPKTLSNPTIFLMHGEKEASLGFGIEIESSLQNTVKTYWPRFGEKVLLWDES